MTSIQTKTTPIYSLNWLRGIAAVLVCLYHFRVYVWHNEIPNMLHRFINYGHLGVIIFFVISGFIIPYSLYNKGYKITNFTQFLVKRTLRIEPPYIIIIALIIMIKYYVYTYITGITFILNIKEILLNITYMAPFVNVEWINVIFWTLAIEFQFYILTGLIYPLLMRSKLIKYSLFVAILALGFVIPDKYQTVFQCYIYFVVGFQTFLFFTKNIAFTEFLLSIVASIVFMYVFKSVEVIPFVVFTVVGIFTLNYKNRIADFFGTISYSLYLTHGLIGGNISLIIKPEAPKFIVYLFILFNAITFAYIYYYVIERLFLNLSKKIKYSGNI
ncbi:MAG: acyltransferase [Bacteroidia bacterium]|nr:acyltransferase [Bacteroidia bacterium]